MSKHHDQMHVDALDKKIALIAADAARREATLAVDASIAARKIAPAQREWGIDYAARDQEGFAKFLRARDLPILAESLDNVPLRTLRLAKMSVAYHHATADDMAPTQEEMYAIERALEDVEVAIIELTDALEERRLDVVVPPSAGAGRGQDAPGEGEGACATSAEAAA